ncbi:MAG TPA: NAD-dependent epimerase/dehydratase family protein [Thermoanaerobaculia bacterium]|nr:NAD-dependent epimerase/dehydratase family protein [Thermoanaerobaculia bacterium]
MKHALVTGGAGFIGSHVVDAYIDRGWRVSVIDNLSTGDRRNVHPKAEFHEADLRDPSTFKLLERLRPDLVNHHAAQIDVRKSVADPAADAEINIVASIRLLQKSVETGVKRFIFASSGGAVYGEPEYVPQDENHPTRPLSPYGCAKLAVEHYMNYYREVHGLSTVALRYANVYGPRQSAKGEAGVIAIFIDRMLRGEEVTINGDGEQTRDYVYIADVVAANVAVAESAATGCMNVGTGVETTVTRIFRELAILCRYERAPRHGPPKEGEQRRSVLRPSLAGREPVPLEEGLGATVEWFHLMRASG